jgi:hypothetical protein
MSILLLLGFVLLFIFGVVLLVRGVKAAGIILLSISLVALLANLAFAFLIMFSDM